MFIRLKLKKNEDISIPFYGFADESELESYRLRCRLFGFEEEIDTSTQNY